MVLWFEFEKLTKGQTCNLTDILELATEDRRVKSFLHGDAEMGFRPADLQKDHHLEPVMVTNDLASDLLYVIDGRHRLAAQHLSRRGFEGVPAFICLHRNALGWAYIPQYHKARLARRRHAVPLLSTDSENLPSLT